jgi:hypothetical protein
MGQKLFLRLINDRARLNELEIEVNRLLAEGDWKVVACELMDAPSDEGSVVARYGLIKVLLESAPAASAGAASAIAGAKAE